MGCNSSNELINEREKNEELHMPKASSNYLDNLLNSANVDFSLLKDHIVQPKDNSLKYLSKSEKNISGTPPRGNLLNNDKISPDFESPDSSTKRENIIISPDILVLEHEKDKYQKNLECSSNNDPEIDYENLSLKARILAHSNLKALQKIAKSAMNPQNDGLSPIFANAFNQVLLGIRNKQPALFNELIHVIHKTR